MTVSRREAILLTLGQADKVMLARDQQSALEGAGVTEPAAPAPPILPPEADLPSRRGGLRRWLPGFLRRRERP